VASTSTVQQVLPLVGDLCIAELPTVREKIDAAIADGARELVLDLSEATLVTAAAVRVFDTTEHRLTGLGGTLWLRNPRPLALRVLQITGFDRLVVSAFAH
jgi:anti-anti-sigma factor